MLIPSKTQNLISLFRTMALAAIAASLIALAALPMPAQNSVPPTARQAATVPQLALKLAHGASRTAHPAQPRASYKNPADAFARTKPGWTPQGLDIYDNGPINGTADAWTINFGFVTSDTFTVGSGAGPITGMSFGAWLYPGDVMQSVEISITSSEFGGTTYFDQAVSFTQSGCSGNQYGFNVCTATSSNFTGPNLAAGTYWVNLQNAIVNDGDPMYWDENSGPSMASENAVGTIPSESFTIMGDNTCFGATEKRPETAANVVTTPPSPTLSYRVIYNFTGGADGGFLHNGLVMDPAGNLYGTTGVGGQLGGGTAFKLSPSASGWRFSRLYSFPMNGGADSTLVRGPDGRLFGTSAAGGQGDGDIFSLAPPARIPASVFSNWMETLLYSFTGSSDGADPGGSFVVDSSGAIYGNAAMGGTNHGGTLYEFTDGGIQVLHAFPAFSGDGTTPIGVVKDSAGLYGITSHGGGNATGTLYTTAGGYQILHSFGPYQLSGGPTSLTSDQAGNLYTSDTFQNCFADGSTVSQFSPPSFGQSILINLGLGGQGALSSWLSTDALGNVYGTTDFGGQNSQGNAFKLTCCWNYTDLHDFSGTNDGFQPLASPLVDAQGNIYGTTFQGGAFGYGVVWEISP